MLMKDFHELCKSGAKPLIKMRDNIHDYLEESMDPGMIGQVIDVSIAYEDSYRVLIDLNEYEDHNKSVAIYDWKDDNGELTKSWFDTSYYPKDGIEQLYFPLNIETPFEILDENSLFLEYLGSKGMNYVEWLENYILTLENKVNNNESIAGSFSLSDKLESVTLPVNYQGKLPLNEERE